jgi:hypothetical protein
MAQEPFKGKGAGGMSFSRGAMPNFMAKMSQGNGALPDVGGIEGALERRRREGRELEPEDREDDAEEAPQVVDALDALTGKERRQLETAPLAGGSLRFKGDSDSAAARFQESAHKSIQEAAEAARRMAEAEAEAEAVPGKMVFNANAGERSKKKHKKGADTRPGAPSAKRLDNSKLLSFAEEDEET